MLETVLNVGLCERSLRGVLRLTGNPRLAWDSYRRLIANYGETVLGCVPSQFATATAAAVSEQGVASERMLDTAGLRALAAEYRKLIERAGGPGFPEVPRDQLAGAIEAVWRSWNSPRAIEYRRLNRLEDLAGTAVTVQAMVFGNAGASSGAGVGFTRNPATGENALYVDFLPNAQGEDVVSGRHAVLGLDAARPLVPAAVTDLEALAPRLEAAFGDVQDFEFTIQEGKLYVLQTRRAKRSAWAAVRIAVDLVAEGLTTPQQALESLQPYDLDAVERRAIAPIDDARAVATAVSANMGAAVGPVAFDCEGARALAARGAPAILVRADIDTADLPGLAVAAGLLTARGGRTSHGAVIARQLDKVCLVGCTDLTFDGDGRSCRIGGTRIAAGDVISLDGNTGTIYEGGVTVTRERPEHALATIAGWRAGASSPEASAA
jgi:pyruvate,orthophosphate dikinase